MAEAVVDQPKAVEIEDTDGEAALGRIGDRRTHALDQGVAAQQTGQGVALGHLAQAGDPGLAPHPLCQQCADQFAHGRQLGVEAARVARQELQHAGALAVGYDDREGIGGADAGARRGAMLGEAPVMADILGPGRGARGEHRADHAFAQGDVAAADHRRHGFERRFGTGPGRQAAHPFAAGAGQPAGTDVPAEADADALQHPFVGRQRIDVLQQRLADLQGDIAPHRVAPGVGGIDDQAVQIDRVARLGAAHDDAQPAGAGARYFKRDLFVHLLAGVGQVADRVAHAVAVGAVGAGQGLIEMRGRQVDAEQQAGRARQQKAILMVDLEMAERRQRFGR